MPVPRPIPLRPAHPVRFICHFLSSPPTYSSVCGAGMSLRAVRGSAGDLGSIQSQRVNHAPDGKGEYIQKQVMIPNDRIPGVTGFSRAVLKPKQVSAWVEVAYRLRRCRYRVTDDVGPGSQLLPHVIATRD
jgi:hypothetical protein